MPNSMATLSRRLGGYFLSRRNAGQFSKTFCTTIDSFSPREDSLSGLEESSLNSDADLATQSLSSTASSHASSEPERVLYDRPLEKGLDSGIYKAILVGQVGQPPILKRLKSGREVTLFSLGTGGIRHNRRPLQNENPGEHANQATVQWHRVSVYPENLARTVMKHLVPGSIVYVEGNLETKLFSDPRTGLARRIREVAIRRNGRLIFLARGGDDQAAPSEVKGAGNY